MPLLDLRVSINLKAVKNMFRAIFYKEWIKTRWFLLVALLAVGGTTIYTIFRMAKVFELKGAAHIWEVMITRNAIFIDIFQYIPVFVGIVFALMQYIPEMNSKRLKLTLHLPCSGNSLLSAMQSFGVVALLGVLVPFYVIMLIYMPSVMAVELYQRVLLTSLPWFLAAFSAYFIVTAIVLEPTWKRRVIYCLFALPIISIYFLSSTPAAYTQFYSLVPLTVIQFLFAFTSVARFKAGAQD